MPRYTVLSIDLGQDLNLQSIYDIYNSSARRRTILSTGPKHTATSSKLNICGKYFARAEEVEDALKSTWPLSE